MGTKKSQVDKLIELLVQSIEKQQEQINFLLEERKILEDRIKMQHERWVSGVRLYQDHISQIKDALVEKDMACLVEDAKSDLIIGLKQREASLLKLKLEQTEDELVDFKTGFDYLSDILQKSSTETDNRIKEGRQDNLKSSASKKLDNEIKRLKLEYEKLFSERNSEISALLKEKSFVWNQYSVLESNLSDKLKTKQAELDQANNKVAKVLPSVEWLQLSNTDKDEVIANLKSELAEVELDRDKLKEELSQLTRESELMKKSRSSQVTPSLKCANEAPKPSSRGAKSGLGKGSDLIMNKELSSGTAASLKDGEKGRSSQVTPSLKCANEAPKPSSRGAKSGLGKGSDIIVKKELSSGTAASLKDGEKGSRTLKRKAVDVINVPETPKLFSSAFKVPKLKAPSVPVT